MKRLPGLEVSLLHHVFGGSRVAERVTRGAIKVVEMRQSDGFKIIRLWGRHARSLLQLVIESFALLFCNPQHPFRLLST